MIRRRERTSEIFTQLILLAITIIGAIITAYVVPFVKSKFTAEEITNLTYYIGLAVRAAEQIYTPEQWAIKKEYVFKYAKEIIAEKLNITLTDAQLDAIIEGVVNEVKKGGI